MALIKTFMGGMLAVAVALQGLTEAVPPTESDADQPVVVDGAWTFLREDAACTLSLNLRSRARPAILIKFLKGEGTTLLAVAGANVTNSLGRPLPLYLEIDDRAALGDESGDFKMNGEPAYLWAFPARYAPRLIKAKALSVGPALGSPKTIFMDGGEAAKNAMQSCVGLELPRPFANVTPAPTPTPTPSPVVPAKKGDRRFCWFDYCPCDTADPDYGGPDAFICRRKKAGLPVDDEMMSGAAGMRDVRRQIREHRDW